jgi:hypothetical protein
MTFPKPNPKAFHKTELILIRFYLFIDKFKLLVLDSLPSKLFGRSANCSRSTSLIAALNRRGRGLLLGRFSDGSGIWRRFPDQGGIGWSRKLYRGRVGRSLILLVLPPE